MREILTGLAVVVIVVLFAAIVGPRFVDWNGQRARVEAELGKRLGVPVQIDGDVGILLLPTPTLSAKAISISDPSGAIAVKADDVLLYLAPQALLQGRLQVTEMKLSGPVVTLDRAVIDRAGRKDIAFDIPALKRISIEKLSISNGSVRLRDAPEGSNLISGIDADIAAPSLAGPIRGTGTIALEGRTPVFRFSTGEMSQQKVSLDLLYEDTAGGLKAETQGVLQLNADEITPARSYSGSVQANGSVAFRPESITTSLPWRIEGHANVRPEQFRLEQLSLVLGARPAEMSLKGNATYTAADGLISATLSSRQLDADAIFGSNDPRRITPVQFVTRIQGAMRGQLDAASLPDAATRAIKSARIELKAEAMTVGGDQIKDVHLVMGSANGAFGVESLSANAPFGGKISFLGNPATAEGLGSGRLALSLPDLPRFQGWVFGAENTPSTLRSVDLAGEVVWDEMRVQLRDAGVRTNDMAWTGNVGWTPPDPATNPNGLIELALSADTINLDALPLERIGASAAAALPSLDVDLSVKTVRFGDGRFGGVKLDAERIGDRLSIKSLSVDDFGGAAISARGELTPSGDTLSARLKATDLKALAAFANRVSPGPIASWFGRTAKHLAPADTTISLTSQADSTSSDRTLSLTIDGTLGSTTASISGMWRASVGPGGSPGQPSQIGLVLESPDAAQLVNQIGLENRATNLGSARLIINGKGSIAGGVDVDASAEGTTGRSTVKGRIALTAPVYPLTGRISLNAFDLGRLAAATGIDPRFLPSGRSGYVDGDIYGSFQKLLISNLEAEIAGEKYKGEIAFNLAKGGRVAGQLRVDRLDLSPVLGIPFGTWPKAKPGEQWAKAPFGPSDPPVLNGDLWIEAEALRIAPQFDLTGARFVLRFDKNFLQFENADARFAGGRITGDVILRRAEDSIQLSTRLAATDLDLTRYGPVGAGARVSGKIEASASGLSPASLVSSSAGGGTITVSNVTLDRLDPAALDRVAQSSLATFESLGSDALISQFETELKKAPLKIAQASLPLSLAGGTLRLGPSTVRQPGVNLQAFGSADLKKGILDGRLAMASTAAIANIKEVPQAVINWSGTANNLSRRTDLGTFTAAVTDRAIEIEQEKSRTFEEDLRERAMFNRRYKADLSQIEAEKEAEAEREKEALITIQSDRIRLHFERIRLESEARREKKASDAEFVRERERAATLLAPRIEPGKTPFRLEPRQSAATRSFKTGQPPPEGAKAPLSLTPENFPALKLDPKLTTE